METCERNHALANLHGSARQLAWLDFATCMVPLAEVHGWTSRSAWFGFRRCMVGLENRNLQAKNDTPTRPPCASSRRRADHALNHPAIGVGLIFLPAHREAQAFSRYPNYQESPKGRERLQSFQPRRKCPCGENQSNMHHVRPLTLP